MYHYKDTEGKLAWRGRCIAAIRSRFPNGVPHGQLVVILGGIYTDEQGEIIPGSEVEDLLRSGLIQPSQIVSVDCDKKIVEKNDRNVFGIRNLWRPLKSSQKERETCGVKWGEIGGIANAVKGLVEAGEVIAVINADLMATSIKETKTVVSIMQSMNRQKEASLLIVNLAAFCRKYGNMPNVLEQLKADKEFAFVFRRRNGSRSIWRESDVLINGKNSFEYTSNKVVMETIFLLKEVNHRYRPLKPAYVKKLRVKKVKKEKDPAWVLAGLKAWQTRQANLAKKARLNK